MSLSKDEIQARFICPKCHGRSGHAREVALPSGPLSRVLPVKAARFVAVSCTLCGYTEFYDLAAVVQTEEPIPGKAKLAEGIENA